MHCRPRRIATNRDGTYTYQCRRCGEQVTSREPAEKIVRACSAAPKKSRAPRPKRAAPFDPGDPRCACQIGVATQQWIHAGRPELVDGQQAERLAICQACKHWPQNDRLAFSIGMPTLRCPLTKWPQAAVEPSSQPSTLSPQPSALSPPLPPSSRRPVTLTGKLAVCTAYFNPARYQTRRDNFARFRDAALEQGADLWVIEAETGPPFEVEERDGMHVLHLSMRSMLWQKERSLNVLIAQLPPEYDRVAWVDGDLLFDNPGWVAATAQALEQHRVVQCFGECVWLDRDGRPGGWHGPGAKVGREGAAKLARRVQPVHFGQGHPGFAWAARREVIEAMGGLYDTHVLGSGDTVMAIGFYGWFEHPYIRQFLGKFRAAAERWHRRAYHVVRGDVGHVPGLVRHLWHGSRKDRRYDGRISRLALAGFNPDEHLVLGRSGLWEWSPTVPPKLRELVEGYFALRSEDG